MCPPWGDSGTAEEPDTTSTMQRTKGIRYPAGDGWCDAEGRGGGGDEAHVLHVLLVLAVRPLIP
eukprot:1577052-Rhodomonas_salina.2